MNTTFWAPLLPGIVKVFSYLLESIESITSSCACCTLRAVACGRAEDGFCCLTALSLGYLIRSPVCLRQIICCSVSMHYHTDCGSDQLIILIGQTRPRCPENEEVPTKAIFPKLAVVICQSLRVPGMGLERHKVAACICHLRRSRAGTCCKKQLLSLLLHPC